MNINIFATGKLKEDYLRSACKEYEKRLGAFGKIIIDEAEPFRLPENPSPNQISAALSAEGERVLKKLSPNSFVIALCIEGKELSSEKLASRLKDEAVNGKSSVDIILGSSYGLSDEVKNRSDLRLSMSQMTFPHQLARVMVLEQIYRAFSINANKKYHK